MTDSTRILDAYESETPARDAAGDEPRAAGGGGGPSAREPLVVAGLYVASILGALVVSAILVVVATDGSARDVFTALLDGSLRSPGAWGLTLTTAAPLLLVACGSIVSTRAGLINIGQEGQVLIGSCFAAYVAVRLGTPGWSVVVLSLLAGAVGGGAWAGVAAGLRRWRRVPEVLTTLLLTFISFPLITYGLSQSWLLADRNTERRNQLNTGEQLPSDALLPDLRVFGNDIDTGFFIALGLTLALAWMIARTVLGVRIGMLGLNPRAAQRFGVSSERLTTWALIGAGATAGAAGGVLLTGGAAGDRLVFGFAGNFGWDGLLIALLARNRLLVAIPMAFVFAMLRTGSSFLAATGVNRTMTDVVQALLVLALLVPPAILFVRDRRRSLRAAAEDGV
ncbi:MAG: ABC transporter permease [Actinomycetota bacterium]